METGDFNPVFSLLIASTRILKSTAGRSLGISLVRVRPLYHGASGLIRSSVLARCGLCYVRLIDTSYTLTKMTSDYKVDI